MKVLIQNRVTQRYLCDDGKDRWSADAEAARDFGVGLAAIDHAIKQELLDCQVVLRFSSREYDVVFRLDAKATQARQVNQFDLGVTGS